jgi:hypothetical protein
MDMTEKELKPTLFTRTELDYLTGKLEANGDYSRVLKYRITKKLMEFERLTWPILKSNPLTQSWAHAFIGKIVTAGSNGVTISCNAKEEGIKKNSIELSPLIINEWRARGDLNPGPTA